MFNLVAPLEARVPSDHRLRPIREMVDKVLKRLSPRFDAIYSERGRPSIPPEQLLKALLIQILYTIRSERMLMEQLEYNLLFRWFVGLEADDEAWAPTVFTKNRDRLLENDIARAFFDEVLGIARSKNMISREHFTVDGTLIEAWAGQKSFQKKDEPQKGPNDDDPGNPGLDFHGERRTNATHESKTDPECRLFKKSRGTAAQLCYMGHVLMENRNGLAVDGRVTEANGTAERDAGMGMAFCLPGAHRKTLGGDKNYDTREFVNVLSTLNVTAHVAQNEHQHRSSAIDGRTTRHPGYEVSQRKRKRVEEIFGWLKTIGLTRKTRFRGKRKVGWMFQFALAAYNLVRIRNLTVVTEATA